MDLINNLVGKVQADRQMRKEIRDKKYRILQRFSIRQLQQIYAEYVKPKQDTIQGDTIVATAVLSVLNPEPTRTQYIEKLMDQVPSEQIKLWAKAHKIKIDDIK